MIYENGDLKNRCRETLKTVDIALRGLRALP